MPALNFFYNHDLAQKTRLRQYDLACCSVQETVVDEKAEDEFNFIAGLRSPVELTFAPSLLRTQTTINLPPWNITPLPPDLALAERLTIRAPLELLIVQNALKAMEAELVPVADLVEYTVGGDNFTIFERSLPLYCLPGAVLGLSLHTPQLLARTLQSDCDMVICPDKRRWLERRFYGSALPDLYSALLHRSRYSFESAVTLKRRVMLDQLGVSTVRVTPLRESWELESTLEHVALTITRDTLTNVAFISPRAGGERVTLSAQVQEALVKLAKEQQLSAFYFESQYLKLPSGGFDVTTERETGWPLFRRANFSGQVECARLRLDKVLPLRGS